MKLLVLACLILLIGAGSWGLMIRMPGRSYRGELPPLSPTETECRGELRRHVEKLASEIGERNMMRGDRLSAAADYLRELLETRGYEVHRQEYQVETRPCRNLEVEIQGTVRPDEIVVVGGHYDSGLGTPGANDNASGTAATGCQRHAASLLISVSRSARA